VVARIELWNGDICDLEVDAIVNAAGTALWMSTGVGGALKRRGGDVIEFAAVRQAPVPLGGAIVTTAGSLAARAVIHAVSLDTSRRTSAEAIASAVRSALDRAREAAIADARRKGEVYAQASGLRLGPIMWIREEGGSAAPISMRAQGATAAGPVPIATGEDTLQVRVMVGFDVVR
jgi:hypothetical protein